MSTKSYWGKAKSLKGLSEKIQELLVVTDQELLQSEKEG